MEIYSTPPFPITPHHVERKKKFVNDFTKCLVRQTDSLDQDQTAQTAQSYVVSTLSDNLWDIFFLKNITLKYSNIQVFTICLKVYQTFFF